MAFCSRMLFFLLTLLGTAVSQWEPSATDPPHTCPNFGLCAPFVSWNATAISCPASQCVCQPGTTGIGCTTVVDQCASKPCLSAGNFICTSSVGGYSCSCDPGFTGSKCDIPIGSICATSPCYNGGTCKSKDGVQYTCTCPSGYVAPYCQYKDPCANNICGTHAKCSSVYDGQNFLCTCDYDYMGRYCALRATTWTGSVTFGCYAFDNIINDATKYKKITDNSMTFTLCDQLLRNDTSDGVIYTMYVVMEKNCYLTTGNWLNTSVDYFQKNPKDNDCWKTCPAKGSTDLCGTNNKKVFLAVDNATTTAPDTCKKLGPTACGNDTGNGLCINMHPTVAGFDGFMCICKPPYFPSAQQNSCIILADPCLLPPCQNGGVCTPLPDFLTFKCDCPHPYVGDTCLYTNPCDPNPCEYGGTCENLNNGDYKCHCLKWYNEKNCTEINACDYANPCVNGDCSDLGTGIQVRPRCKCKDGWNGVKCDQQINYCTVLEPCGYNSTCTASFNNYSCACIPGIKGRNCSEIINNCVKYKDASGKEYPNRCMTKDGQAHCINAINSFSCNCSANWRGQFCEMNVIIEDVMLSLFGQVNWELLPLLNNLLNSPAAIATMVPFYLGTIPLTNRTTLSWDYDEMFYWAAYEEKELDLQRDFFKWNDVVLGNCFTFNHYSSKQLYNVRSSKSEGGLRVRMKINQMEYEPWTETAAMMVFIHNKADYIFSESIRYNAEPNSEIIMNPYGTGYTRLGGSYGRCVEDPDEVESYYYPGRYTADGCYRSCYQDLIKKSCKCMDPRYPMPEGETSCVVTDMSCIDAAVEEWGDPSSWPFCTCPVPCVNQDFSIKWSKSSYRSYTPNCLNPETYDHDAKCQNNTADSLLITVSVPKLTFSLYQETPQMDLNKFIGSLGGLLGVLMGIGAIAFIEVVVAVFRVSASACCFNEQKARRDWEKKKAEEEKPIKRAGEK